MTMFNHGDRVRWATVDDDGLPLVRYGFVGGVTGTNGPIVVMLDGELGGDVINPTEIEPVHMSNVTLTLSGTDLLDDPSLASGSRQPVGRRGRDRRPGDRLAALHRHRRARLERRLCTRRTVERRRHSTSCAPPCAPTTTNPSWSTPTAPRSEHRPNPCDHRPRDSFGVLSGDRFVRGQGAEDGVASGHTDDRNAAIGRTGPAQERRSMIMAMPWPPPTHIDSIPNVLSSVCRLWINVVMMRAPVMPNG